MGGHGGLNILPQKSWNVYSARNRARVAADEEQAAIEAQNARVAEAAETARKNLLTLRARVGGDNEEAASSAAAAAAPRGHVNFFQDLEAAEQRSERETARKREDARLVARLMPDLDLSKSAREPAPWYTQAPPEDDSEDVPEPVPALGNAASSTAEAPAADDRVRRKRRHRDDDSDDDARHHRHHKSKKHDKHDKHHKHSRHGKHKNEARPHRHEPKPGLADAEALARMRQERLARERREQRRCHDLAPAPPPAFAVSVGSNGANATRAGSASAGGGNGEHEAQLRAKFMELTGQQVSVKPRR